jgi:RHS repeat-associated protein
MLRHDDVADDHEAIALASLLQDREEAVAAVCGAQKRQSPVARAGDKVQVMSAVTAVQADGHSKPMVTAASYPPLQKTQGRGTPSFAMGKRNATERVGHPPDAFTYDPNTGRMASYTFSVNGQTDVGALTWNTNGTLNQLKITDNIPGTSDSETCNYLYDDLRRLSTANCGTPWSQTFTYDPFGNISKSGTSSFIPGYSLTQNQFTSIPGRNVSYDGDGNLLTDNLNTYTWDAYGNMSTVNTGSATVTATYDALGRMVENNAGGSYTQIIYGPQGKKLASAHGQTLVKAFVSLPGGAKAVYNSTGLAYYRHSDHLGSSRLASTSARGLYSSTAYAPFGEVQQSQTSGTADASFTGQDQDTVSSLYDFQARRYSPSQGRWISPDPAGRGAVSLANPQSWNRYAYVLNNPMALSDSMGLSVHRRHGARPNVRPIGGDDDDDDDDGGGSNGGDDSSGDDDNSGNNGDCDLTGYCPIDPGPCDAECQQESQQIQQQLDQNCQQGLQEAGADMGAVSRANAAWDTIDAAADANNIDPDLLAAVAIRETGFQNIPQSGGGQGAGIFQIDLGQNPGVTPQQAYDPTFAANFAANMLGSNMATLSAAYPNLNSAQLTQATAASYNFGTGNISGNPATIDVGTTGGNYGSDVQLLMDCF